MGYAVCISFDDETDALVRNTWSRLAGNYVPSPLHGSTYCPHATLGVFAPNDVHEFITVCDNLAIKSSPFDVVFSGIGCFSKDTHAIYAKVEATEQLRRLHAETYAALTDVGIPTGVYYFADKWIPHCTLAWKVQSNRLRHFENICKELPFPFTGKAAKLWIFDDTKEVEIKSLLIGRNL